ncbi:MAG: sialate O-acetylesterase [Rhodothermales bacterium]|jgi:sialate O-acetylesterase
MILRLHLLLATLLALSSASFALEVDRIYGSNMVLQRDMELPIRGKATPGADVTFAFAGQTATGKADETGRWTVLLQPLKASSDNRSLKITSSDKSVTLANILVGEVWVGSGQSNMAGKVASYMKNDPTLAKIAEQEFPLIRLRSGKEWLPATPAVSKGHSAILFAFGERLHRELGVPVGLFVGAVGGTPSGAWIPKETFDTSTRIKAEIAEFAKTHDQAAAMRAHQKKLAAWEKAAAKAKAEGKKPRGRRPGPPAKPGESTRGRATGGLFDNYIRYAVGLPMRGVLWDQGEARSGIQGLDQHTAMSELIRGWRELWGQGDFPFLFAQKPSGMGNAFSKENPITREAEAFTALPDISKVNSGEQRYLYVRLMQDNANSWMVPACDLGASIHPKNKWGYGNRAAEVAAQKVYKIAGIQAYGPIYLSHTAAGNTVTVSFSEAGSGLTVKHSDTIQGFAVAGKDGKWRWAKATLVASDTVRLSSAEVASPVHVRFAYAGNRTWANLFNKEGLPALAFTTAE